MSEEPPAGTGDGPDAGWRWETTVAAVCTFLLPWWCWVTEGNSNAFWEAVVSVVVGVGIGTGIAGVRRGNLTSRNLAILCLGTQLIAAAFLVVIGVLSLLGNG